jgi:hypothetical protein
MFKYVCLYVCSNAKIYILVSAPHAAHAATRHSSDLCLSERDTEREESTATCTAKSDKYNNKISNHSVYLQSSF